MAEEENDVRTITITITDSNIQYDTSFSLPEMVFWLESVKDIAINKALYPNPPQE